MVTGVNSTKINSEISTPRREGYKLPQKLVAGCLIISGIAMGIISSFINNSTSPITAFILVASASASVVTGIWIYLKQKPSAAPVPTASTLIPGQTEVRKLPEYDKVPNNEELKIISFIFTSLGSQSVLTLPVSKGALQQAGRDIGNVHILRFFSTALNDKQLKIEFSNLYNRRKSFIEQFVWLEFYNTNSKKLDRLTGLGNIIPYLDQFAKDISLDSAILHKIVENKRWEDFFKYIIEKTPPPPTYSLQLKNVS